MIKSFRILFVLLTLSISQLSFSQMQREFVGTWESSDQEHAVDIWSDGNTLLGSYGFNWEGEVSVSGSKASFNSGYDFVLELSGGIDESCGILTIKDTGESIEVCKEVPKEEISDDELLEDENEEIENKSDSDLDEETEKELENIFSPETAAKKEEEKNDKVENNQSNLNTGCRGLQGTFNHTGRTKRRVTIWEDNGVCKAQYSSPEDGYNGRGVDTVTFINDTTIEFLSTWDMRWEFDGNNCGTLSWGANVNQRGQPKDYTDAPLCR